MADTDDKPKRTAVVYIRTTDDLHARFYVRLAEENRSASEVGEELISEYLARPPRPRHRHRKRHS